MIDVIANCDKCKYCISAECVPRSQKMKFPNCFESTLTNEDRIKAMSTAQLAEFLAEIMDNCWNAGRCGECSEDCPMYKCCNDQFSANIDEWLKQEVCEG